jgi:hypothetical protein
MRLKIIIGLLKFRTFSNRRKGSIKSGLHFSAKLTKKHGFPINPLRFVKNFATDGASYETIFLG